MNYIWLFMFVVGGTICAVVKGPNFLTQVTLDSAKDAITFAIGISGSIALWSGIMKIGGTSGHGQQAIAAHILTSVSRCAQKLQGHVLDIHEHGRKSYGNRKRGDPARA